MLFVYDFEVFRYDWIVSFKLYGKKKYYTFHNDTEGLRNFIEAEPTIFGFNNKHYDQYILKSALNGKTPEEIKIVNDFIISGNNGWEHPNTQKCNYKLKQYDIKDDMQQGISLKSIEAHLGMDIVECSVPWDIDRPLTDDEVAEVIKYNHYDCDAAEILHDIRLPYLDTKKWLGEQIGMDDYAAMYLTNARLVSKYLGAEQKPHDDEREYSVPENLLRDYIPDDVFVFFDNIHDKSITDDDLFSRKLELKIGDCDVTLGWGGIHGAIPNYIFPAEKNTGYKILRNRDVKGYYPHQMWYEGYCSRNIPSPQTFIDVVVSRDEAKAAGRKQEANAKKLVTNTTFGAMKQSTNDLYDPLMARSVCITGQLRLLELAYHLHYTISSLKIVQLNTDGIMIELNKKDEVLYDEICQEWQDRTRYELEEDLLSAIVQKDVNNYFAVFEDGHTKVKGGMLTRGISANGAWSINNNYPIVSAAMVSYWEHGTPVEETISKCTDPLQFQIITKGSGAYSAMKHNGETVQKCNRVYASKNKEDGTMFRINKKTGAECKYSGAPEHCIIDNDNKLSVDDIDIGWYIALAIKQIKSFEGGNKMANTTNTAKIQKNIYQKLANARTAFASEAISKSGKNLHAEYKYFELEDIVPEATKCFAKEKCMFICSFPSGRAEGVLVDLENPDERICVGFDTRPIAEPGKFRMNETQARGAEITYMRRYLYAIILDLLDPDKIDGGVTAQQEKAPATITAKKETVKKAAPATPKDRVEIKETLTNADGAADELQIKALKAVMKDYRDKTPDGVNEVQSVVAKTNKLKNLSKKEAEKLIKYFQKKLDNLDMEEL